MGVRLNFVTFSILKFILLPKCFSNNNYCSINNCLECQVTALSEHEIKCDWNDNQCSPYYGNDKSSDGWEKYFQICLSTENNSNHQILDSLVNKDIRYNSNYPDSIQLSQGIKEGDYIEWKRDYSQVSSIKKKEILFKLDFKSIHTKDKLTFIFLFGSKKKRFPIEEFKDQTILASGITGFEIYYYSYNYKSTTPFKIEIDDYEPPLKKVYIVIISIIGVLVFIGLIYVVIVCVSRCINKRLNRMQYNIYEIRNNGIVPIREVNRNADNFIIIQDSNNNSGIFPIVSGNLNQNEVESLKKTIKEKDMAPVNYKEDFNIFKDSCTICREDFKEGVKVVVLSCKHIFHFDCVKDYLTKSNIKCPNCNKDLTKKDVNTKNNVNDINKEKSELKKE